MTAAMVLKVLTLIPERTVRAQSGAAFLLEGSSCAYPERVGLLASFLNWMSPLASLSKDAQRALGLVGANGRPVQPSATEEDAEEQEGAEPEEDETEDLEADDTEADDTEADDTEAQDSEPLDAWEPEPAAPSGVVQHAAGQEDFLNRFGRR